MIDALRTRLRPVGFTGLALAGTWLGHALEYGRVAGARGLAAGLTGPIHGYMPIAGALSLALALLFGADAVAAWRVAVRRTIAARKRLRTALRGHLASAPSDQPWESPPSLRPGTLLASLTAVQVLLYTVQENVEAAAAGSTVPGPGAITGVHWAAPLIHMGVAAFLTTVVVCVRRLIRREETDGRRVEALLRRVIQRLHGSERPQPPVPLSVRTRAPMPGQRRRAPPALATA